MKKTVLFIFLCAFFIYSNGMFLLPGKLQHPFWPDEIYQVYAATCFVHISDMKTEYKEKIKGYVFKKIKDWQSLFDNQESYDFNKQLAYEQYLFGINWNDTSQFELGYVTITGHINTVLLQSFFKEFVNKAEYLYYQANIRILENRMPILTNYDANYETDILKKLYPVKEDTDIGKLKEGQKLFQALLNCFETP